MAHVRIRDHFRRADGLQLLRYLLPRTKFYRSQLSTAFDDGLTPGAGAATFYNDLLSSTVCGGTLNRQSRHLSSHMRLGMPLNNSVEIL